MDAYELINKLIDSLNELISKDNINFRTTNLSNKLLETLKIIENCTSCEKDKINEYNFNYLHELINELKSEKVEQEKKVIINKLNEKLIYIDDELNRKVLCEGCKKKKIENLIIKCGNEEMAELLYQSKLNSDNIYYVRWIPFNEFKNIEYLAKGGFGEVQKAVWIGHGYYYRYVYKEREVVIKRLYNSRDKILDILKEVNKKKV
jgi:hypothetical protein